VIHVDGKPVCPVAEGNKHFTVEGTSVLHQGRRVATVQEMTKAAQEMPAQVAQLRNRIKMIRSSPAFNKPNKEAT